MFPVLNVCGVLPRRLDWQRQRVGTCLVAKSVGGVVADGIVGVVVVVCASGTAAACLMLALLLDKEGEKSGFGDMLW